jgi:hypothetical protein
LVETAAAAAAALGMRHGPVHAELRHNAEGAWILETHARPIGGLCARALRFEGGMTLEEVILRHAVGEDMGGVKREARPAGVMMIPIPKEGIYEDVVGVDRAAAVAGVEDVVITAKSGQRMVKLPEGSSYLGFIFARGATAAEVEEALRKAHGALRFQVATALETLRP